MHFTFIPHLPTAAAYANKEFTDFNDLNVLLATMRRKEKERKVFYTGYIWFRPGFKCTYDDGTRGKPKLRPWWEDPRNKGCHKGCCKRDVNTPPPKTLEVIQAEEAQKAKEKAERDAWFEEHINRYGDNIEFRHVADLMLKLSEMDMTQIQSINITGSGKWSISI